MSLALGINPVHSFESKAYFLEHILPQDYRVVVVLDESTSRRLFGKLGVRNQPAVCLIHLSGPAYRILFGQSGEKAV